MIINIRRNIFETNSSSMHSIAIRKEHHMFNENGLPNIYLNSKGKKNVYDFDLSFGRYPFRPLLTLFEKALYLIAIYRYEDEFPEDWAKKNIYPIIKKYYPKFTGFNYPTETYSDEINYGYVDLGLSCLLKSFFVEHNISIEEFLTDTAYVVFIDGDEYYELQKYLDFGLIHKEDFEIMETL